MPDHSPVREVRVPDSTWNAALRATEETGLSINQLVTAALEAFAEAHRRRTRG